MNTLINKWIKVINELMHIYIHAVRHSMDVSKIPTILITDIELFILFILFFKNLFKII